MAFQLPSSQHINIPYKKRDVRATVICGKVESWDDIKKEPRQIKSFGAVNYYYERSNSWTVEVTPGDILILGENLQGGNNVEEYGYIAPDRTFKKILGEDEIARLTAWGTAQILDGRDPEIVNRELGEHKKWDGHPPPVTKEAPHKRLMDFTTEEIYEELASRGIWFTE